MSEIITVTTEEGKKDWVMVRLFELNDDERTPIADVVPLHTGHELQVLLTGETDKAVAVGLIGQIAHVVGIE